MIPEMAITCALGTALLTASGWMCTGPEIKCGEPCPSRDTHYSGWIETAPQVGSKVYPTPSLARTAEHTLAGSRTTMTRAENLRQGWSGKGGRPLRRTLHYISDACAAADNSCCVFFFSTFTLQAQQVCYGSPMDLGPLGMLSKETVYEVDLAQGGLQGTRLGPECGCKSRINNPSRTLS